MSLLETTQVLGNLGEFVGSIVIVATLVYLVVQVRQNSELIRASAAATFLQISNDMVNTITRSRENAEYWLKGRSDYEDLDEVDQTRLTFHETIGFAAWNFCWELRQKDLLSDERWSLLNWQIRRMGSRQSVHAAWQLVKSGFGQDFRDFVESNLEVGEA